MYYGTTTLGTPMPPPSDNWRARTIRMLLWFIPRANPDHERLFPQVRRWLLEVDDSGSPCREIGLDEAGAPLFASPDKRNLGFFTDSNLVFSRADLAPSDRAEFEKLWSSATPNTSLERTREG